MTTKGSDLTSSEGIRRGSTWSTVQALAGYLERVGSNTRWRDVGGVADSASNIDQTAQRGPRHHALAWFYDAISQQWKRAQGDGNGRLRVDATIGTAPYTYQDGGVEPIGNAVSQVWALLTHRDQATATAGITRGGYTGLVPATARVGVLNALPLSWYNSTAPAAANGEGVANQGDTAGNLLVMPAKPAAVAADSRIDASWSNFQSVTVGTYKGAAGKWLRVVATNGSGTPLYFCLQNKATNPAAGETAGFCVYVPARASVAIDGGPRGIPYGTGLAFAWSSTIGTLTLPGAGTDLASFAEYV